MGMTKKGAAEGYVVLSKRIRRTVLDMIYKTQSPHIGSSFSIVEILVALYFKFLNVSANTPFNPNRDRFVLSKGHACPSLYVVLKEKGFLTEQELEGFAIDNGVLDQHPNKDIKRGIEVSTGSLGHGLSIGVGMSLAAKKDNVSNKVYVLMSDGELNEGSTWEAVMFASHHRLDNLIAIIDYNKIQALGYTNDIINLEPLTDKLTSFGWRVKEIDGHNFMQIFEALEQFQVANNQPSVIIAHTIKGKGVSFMENSLLWHYRAPNDREYHNACKELAQ